MGNHFRRGDGAEASGFRHAHPLGVAVQKTGGVSIAGARGVEDFFNRFGLYFGDGIALDDDGAFFAPCQRGNFAFSFDDVQRFFKPSRP